MGSDKHLKVYLREEINDLIDNTKIIIKPSVISMNPGIEVSSLGLICPKTMMTKCRELL
jgi:hypothetical protein